MAYQNAKIYFDGSHFVATPRENFPAKRHKKKPSSKRKDEEFETVYAESQSLPKKQQKKFIQEQLNKPKAYVEEKLARKWENMIRRKVRLTRKVYLQRWNYFCTFTYNDAILNEEAFKKKLSNTLKHMVKRKQWKYIGVWERSPEKQRLHFHGIFYIPEQIGELKEVNDYSTKMHRRQTTLQNTHFLKQFGRNDFHPIDTQADTLECLRYLMKYLEKTGERLVYGGKLPTYFLSDILDDDIVCPIGLDDRKALLFDDFACFIEGEYMGQVSREVIDKLPKCN